MSTTTEAGHINNVSLFERLHGNCALFGPEYNPGNNLLSLESMTNLLITANGAMSAISRAESALADATTDRKQAFAAFETLMRRVDNALQASGAPEEKIEKTRQLIRVLLGIRATPRKSAGEVEAAKALGETVNQKSSARTGFDARIENLGKLIDLLKTISQYKPNESDLSASGLATYHGNLKAKNSAVMDAENRAALARGERDKILYGSELGLVNVASGVKQYIKSLYGPSSTQYRTVSQLRFKNVP